MSRGKSLLLQVVHTLRRASHTPHAAYRPCHQGSSDTTRPESRHCWQYERLECRSPPERGSAVSKGSCLHRHACPFGAKVIEWSKADRLMLAQGLQASASSRKRCSSPSGRSCRGSCCPADPGCLVCRLPRLYGAERRQRVRGSCCDPLSVQDVTMPCLSFTPGQRAPPDPACSGS